MDFMRDTLADRRVFRTLNIVDDYTRECLAIEVDTSLLGTRVVRVLEHLAAAVGQQPAAHHRGQWARVREQGRRSMGCQARRFFAFH